MTLTVYTHYYVPGKRVYTFRSRDFGSNPLQPNSGDGQCALELESEGQVYDSETRDTDDVFRQRIYLTSSQYVQCSVDIEWHGAATSFLYDHTTMPPGSSARYTQVNVPFSSTADGSVISMPCV